MSIRVLVFGATGMLGHKLMQVLSTRFDITGTVRQSPDTAADAFARHPVFSKLQLIGGVSAEDDSSIIKALSDIKPDVVINAVGLIKQLKDAKNPIPSITINSLFPHRLAQHCKTAGARMFHVSTDCVFSGRKGNYTEQDETDAVDLYGRSKLLGEVDQPGAVTLRTSIVGRELNTTSGLFEWFISQHGQEVKGFEHAIYTGVTTQVLANIIGDLIEHHPNLHGLWQVSSDPITKYDLLRMVNDTLNLGITIHREVDFKCDRSMNSNRFRAETGITPPTWQEMIDEMNADPTQYPAYGKA